MLDDRRFSETIQQLLGQFQADSAPDPLGLRQIVKRSHVLPLFLDMGGCFAVRPSGEIISFGWDTPDEIRVETNPRIRNLVLYQGSKKYPALRGFVPLRPSDAVECPHSKGKGELPEPFGQRNFVCYCGGLGWLPPGDDGIVEKRWTNETVLGKILRWLRLR